MTFVVNGVVKHQAVLLGAAEQPPKKKVSVGLLHLSSVTLASLMQILFLLLENLVKGDYKVINDAVEMMLGVVLNFF